MTINFEDKKITASKDILNYISLIAMQAADSFEAGGAEALAREARELSEHIYDALLAAGLYN